MNTLKLAQAMGVTEKDVISLLNMVTSSMDQDGFKDVFLSMNEQDRVNAVEAYVMAEVKKFSEFCMTLLTNQEKKCAFDQYLFMKLKK